jgi:hypothetical protein
MPLPASYKSRAARPRATVVTTHQVPGVCVFVQMPATGVAWHGACGISAQPPGDDYALEEESPRYRVRCHSGARRSRRPSRPSSSALARRRSPRRLTTTIRPPTWPTPSATPAARPAGRPLERVAGGSCRLGSGGRPRQRARAPGAGRLDAGRPRSGLPRRWNGRPGPQQLDGPASGDSPTANASFVGGGGSGGGWRWWRDRWSGWWWRSRRCGCRWRSRAECRRRGVGEPSGDPRPVMRRRTDSLLASSARCPACPRAVLTLPAVPGVLVIADPASGTPVNTPAPGPSSLPSPGRCCSWARVSRAWPRVACAAAAPVEDSRRYAERPGLPVANRPRPE